MQINQTQQISGLVTALVAALICVYLYTTRLTVNLTRPDEPDPYIEMEFIEVEVEEEIEVPPPPTSFGGDQAAPAITPEDIDEPSTLAPPTGVSLKDNGPKAEETPKTVTTNRPSPVQTEKVEKPTKPTGPQVDNEQKQKEVQARQTANTSTLAAFNKAAKGNANNRDGDKGTAGRKDGQINSAGPATSKSKTPGVGKSRLPGGWGWPAIPTDIKSSEVGTVRIELQLNASGGVEKATVLSNSGLTDATVSQCLARARRLVFSHPANADIGTTATLTFTFKD